MPLAFRELQEKYARFCVSRRLSWEEAKDEFAKLCCLPQIAHVAFTDGGKTLLLGTKPVSLEDPNHRGEWHEIGEFLISIRRCDEAWIKFENVTMQRDGNHHPHISEEGHLCIGDGRTEMMEALARGNIVEGVRFALAALNTYTEYGAFPRAEISAWPRVLKEKEEEICDDD